MTKQELAESMAEFLDFQKPHDIAHQIRRECYFFSPDGFFAVWMEVRRQGYNNFQFWRTKGGQSGAWFNHRVRPVEYKYEGCGGDEYEALYSAVHEMRTKK